jgi:hypothetical protein
MSVLSYEQYLNEKDAPKPSADVDVSADDTGSAEKVDASKGTMRKFNIDNKEYEGVLSTYKALKSKQESIGYESVGFISLPGEKEVYELLTKKEKENE